MPADQITIDLPNLDRRVTIKLGNIVHEEVDVIVNAANMHLYHFMGIAAAIDISTLKKQI